MPRIENQKKKIRSSMREKLRGISSLERDSAGLALMKNLWSIPEMDKAFTILAFFPMLHEINVQPFIKDIIDGGRRLVLPRVEQNHTLDLCEIEDLVNQLQVGAHRIMEPKYGMPTVLQKEIDAVIVPGIAFTLTGERLGQGGGYYDRLLAHRHFVGTPVIAACYDSQIVDSLPQEEHDASMHWVATESRVFKCTG